MFTKDEVFEYLIRKYVDHSTEAMTEVVGRPYTPEDFSLMDDSIRKMYGGWVAMNGRARRLGRT